VSISVPLVVKTILAVIGTSALIWSALALPLSLSSEDETARDGALEWLQLIDSGKYNDAAQMMSEQVRGTRDWANYFAAHRAPLGRANNRQITELRHARSIPSDPELRPHAILRFKTSFEHKAAATEEIVMTKMGCCWEVSDYTISDR
jgi:hypothetical protein